MKGAFLLILCGMLLQLKAQFTDIDVLYRDSFPSDVRAVTLSGYLVSYRENGDTALSEMSSRYTEYDRKGKCIVRFGHFANGEFTSDSMFYYPERKTDVVKTKSNRSSATITKAYNPDGSLNSIFFDNDEGDDVVQEFRYNKRGQLLRFTETYAGQVKVIDYHYTKKGVLEKKSTSFGLVGEKQRHLNESETYRYDSAGRVAMLLLSFYAGDGNIRKTDTTWFAYNMQGKIARQLEVQQGGATKSAVVSSYDSLGRLTEQERLLQVAGVESYSSSIRITYDRYGYCTSFSGSTADSGDSVTWRTTYDASGLPLTCVYTNDAEVLFYTWTYVYW